LLEKLNIKLFKMKQVSSLSKLAVAVFSAITLFASCKKDDAAPATATIQVYHASPDAPTVDLLVDDTKVNTAPVTFINGATAPAGYFNVNAGQRSVKLRPTGSTSTINFTPTFDQGKTYTVFAANRVANIELVAYQDDLTAPVAGKAHVRFIHLSPDAPAVNIFPSSTSTTVLFSNIAFKGSTAFTPIDATTTGTALTLSVRTGTATTSQVLTVPVTLVAGKIYTIVARGFVTPPAGNTNVLDDTIITHN
jgi:Domain of unknown function (DUF4397)